MMGSPPLFMRGVHRAAMRFALEEVESGVGVGDVAAKSRTRDRSGSGNTT